MSLVAVVAGGSSQERDVSIRSGQAVAVALGSRGHQAQVYDPQLGITTLLPELHRADIVFIALHGKGGEDGTIQTVLDQNEIIYTGSGARASAVCFDKLGYSQFLDEHHILTPDTTLVDYARYKTSELSKQPHVLKPNDGGSSIDTLLARDPDSLEHIRVSQLFEHHPRLLLQPLITGIELTIGVLGTEALPVIEIVPPKDQDFDYANKYSGATAELCPPQHINTATQSQAQDLALKIHNLTGCQGMSRTDMIVTSTGSLHVLETNTIPGLTPQSLFPKAAQTAGIPMPELVERLIQLALTAKA